MEVIVDGLIYEMESNGGISRVFREVLPRACNLDPNLQIDIINFGVPLSLPPQHPRILQNRFLGSKFLKNYHGRGHWYLDRMRRLMTRLEILDTRKKIWHSTYYSSLSSWSGPKVVTVYDMIYEKYPLLLPDANVEIARKQREIRKADAIICISHSTKEDLHKYYKVSDKIFSGERTNSGGLQSFLLYVGSRAGYKGFGDLLKALAIGNKLDGVDLIVVGRPFSRMEQQSIEELGIEHRIALYSNIPDEDLQDLYHRAVAFIYPSLAEGFGIPLLEAMACGCPIVASRIPSTVEVAKDIPFYFEPGSPESLHAAIGQAFLEGRKPLRCCEGVMRIRDFSWDKAARETLNVYRSLL
jgi:glycosyltransferase involved in cell wall biosynthesis